MAPSGTPVPDPGLTLKLCLAGDFQVGKTSLVRRFVTNTFDDKYVTTLGAKVGSKRFSVSDPAKAGATMAVSATIWDIMGNPGFRELLKDAYFYHANGVLLVCDATRPETLESLSGWSKSVTSVAGDVPIVVLMNKTDLVKEARFGEREIDALCSPKGWPWLATSAKTGENVETAFRNLTEMYLRGARRPAAAEPSARPKASR